MLPQTQHHRTTKGQPSPSHHLTSPHLTSSLPPSLNPRSKASPEKPQQHRHTHAPSTRGLRLRWSPPHRTASAHVRRRARSPNAGARQSTRSPSGTTADFCSAHTHIHGRCAKGGWQRDTLGYRRWPGLLSTAWSGVEWGVGGQWAAGSGRRCDEWVTIASKRGEQSAADASAGHIHMFVFMFRAGR
jgi:hypothetical protein